MQKVAKQTVEDLIVNHGYIIPYFIIAGSYLYGTETETSDIDYRGVYLMNFYRRVGFRPAEDITFGEDGCLFDVKKFLKLVSENNPNMMEWLFAPSSCVFRLDPDFKRIVFADKQQFVNPAKVQIKFLGYAMSEMSKLTSMHGSLGKKRRKTVEKYGYNVKSASNVLRIVTGGIDLIAHGHMKLPYDNRELLRDIKTGKYTMEEFMSIVMPKIEQLKGLTGLEDKSKQVEGYASGVLVTYLKCKYSQNDYK